MNVNAHIDIRVRESAAAAEIYLTAVPRASASPTEQAQGMFQGIAELLRSHGARILQERVIAAPDRRELLASARAEAYGKLDDGVPPAWLAAPPGLLGPIAGAQAHAVVTAWPIDVLRVDGDARGRMVLADGFRYVAGSGLCADGADEAPLQALSMLAKSERLMAAAGGNMHDVARTWMWLGDILDWYGDFNRVRSAFFTERGLLKSGGDGFLPASTGIGIGPAGALTCAMDVCGVVGGRDLIEFRLAGGNQGPASRYGSAFSRAAAAVTPAGRTVYVSGTAAIDGAGRTMHPGDAPRQIDDTVRNVLAVLRDAGCGEAEIVQAIVYCKTTAVEQVFRDQWGTRSWPHLVCIADICRDDLVFEIEVTAMPGARRTH